MGPHPLEETIILRNPPNGWLVNTNNTPFTAAGSYSPKPGDYPAYMVSSAENARGLHAAQLLEGISGVTLDSLIATAYDSRLPAFDLLLPPLFQAFDQLPASDPQRSRLAAPIELLRGWDRRTATGSVATAVAIFWGQALIDGKGAAAQNSDEPLFEFLTDSADAERLAALDAAVARLTADFGNWRTPWGEINRFQRLSDDVVPAFDDARPSLPVALASARWGALASFDWTAPRRTRRLYGAFGNSFVAAVEFGERVRAKAILAGGESGDPASAHFADQIGDYAKGIFRDVLFYPEDVAAHAERRYHPGE
jgi:acyl-homoserine-lactone acylase